jgi:hypothetical protein
MSFTLVSPWTARSTAGLFGNEDGRTAYSSPSAVAAWVMDYGVMSSDAWHVMAQDRLGCKQWCLQMHVMMVQCMQWQNDTFTNCGACLDTAGGNQAGQLEMEGVTIHQHSPAREKQSRARID